MSSSRASATARAGGRPTLRVAAALFVGAALSPCAADEPAGGQLVTSIDSHLRLVLQAKDGSHWFGSQGSGVYRFDGKAFQPFKP